jgi:hypothetical protein
MRRDAIHMTEQEKQSQIHAEVTQRILDDAVKMRPKWQYTAKTVLTVTGLIFFVLAFFYIVSFAFFVMQQTGVLFAPGFGIYGLHAFLIAFPWILAALAVFFLILAHILIRRYAFAYRRPFIYSVAGLAVIAMIAGVVATITPLHHGIATRASIHRVPGASTLYREFLSEQLRYVHRGTVERIARPEIYMLDVRGDVLQVRVTTKTRQRDPDALMIGDSIMVLGEREENAIEAVGIRRLPTRRIIHPRHMR